MSRRFLALALALAALSVGAGLFDTVDPFAGGQLFVASPDEGSPFQFDTDGNLLPTLISGLTSLRDLVFGPGGALFASDVSLDGVRVFGNDGTVVTKIRNITGLEDPAGLAFGPEGGLFVASSGDDRVVKINRKGEATDVIGLGELDDPRDLAFASDGHLFVTSFGSDEVIEFDASGVRLGTLGDGTGLSGPHGILVGPQGQVLVAASGADVVFQYDRDGAVMSILGPGTGLTEPTDMVFGPDRNLYVASGDQGLVFVLNAQGQLVDTIGLGAGITSPSGLAIAPQVLGATLKGRSLSSDGNIKINADARVNIIPGSGQVTLHLVDPDADTLAALGGDVLVFTGFEGLTQGGKDRLTFVGRSASSPALGGSNASLNLVCKLDKPEAGQAALTISNGTGELDLIAPSGQVSLKVNLKTKLP